METAELASATGREGFFSSASFFQEARLIAIYLGSRLGSVVVDGNRDVLIFRLSGIILCGFGAFTVTVVYSRSSTIVLGFFQDIFNIFALGVNAPVMLLSG